MNTLVTAATSTVTTNTALSSTPTVITSYHLLSTVPSILHSYVYSNVNVNSNMSNSLYEVVVISIIKVKRLMLRKVGNFRVANYLKGSNGICTLVCPFPKFMFNAKYMALHLRKE